jgi:hypothetical protein
MSLAKQIHININYTRSINLERDANSAAIVKTYIPTTRALDTLKRIGNTVRDVGHMPRAWTLMGPYGSGKSSFAIFLSHLLGSQEKDTTIIAQTLLEKTDEEIFGTFLNGNDQPQVHCSILLTGSPEPLSKRLAIALLNGARSFFSHKKYSSRKIVGKLEKLAIQDKITTTQIIESIQHLQEAITEAKGEGLIIIIDELGKFLEYEARHPKSNDIYLLQALAEHAYKGCEQVDGAILSVFVLLHQSFEQYARSLGKAQRNEWIKVQGRFEIIPFLESTEQTLRIIGKTIEQPVEISKFITNSIQPLVSVLDKAQALPSSLDKFNANRLFTQCYPLHPISALLLPLLCQKVAQNERTLFNYLGSNEINGFKSNLLRLKKVGDFVYPWEIYDYFISNQSVAVVDHLTHRRWIEIITALERLSTEEFELIQLLKTVGLLNLIGAQAGLKASKEVLSICLPSPAQVNTSLHILQSRSLLQFRKYNNEYRVWQGSDFDLEERLQKEHEKLRVFSLAEYLNKQYSSTPIVARKFSIQKGGLQYFNKEFVDANSLHKINASSIIPRIIFYLAEDDQNDKNFHKQYVATASPLDILVKYSDSKTLRNAVAEVLALESIQDKSQELHSDPVAQRELRDYMQIAHNVEKLQVALLLEHPQHSLWYWQQKPLNINSKRDFQSCLSDVLGKLYYKMPIIKNELINRDKPSSQASAGRNKLLEMMLQNADKEDLGIEKFPPEKAMYRAVLHETGIHQKDNNGHWKFHTPPSHSSIHSTWLEIEAFLASTNQQAHPFSKLNQTLTQAPYGLKKGILPILYLAAYIIHQDELALYEDGAYLPTMTKDALERFVKTPDLFKVQLFRIEGIRATLFKEYMTALFIDEQKRTVIQAIKPLATFVSNLNEYTQKTNDLPAHAKAFRNAFHLAKSPEQLLFEGIPKALGFNINISKKNEFDGYVDKLKDVLSTLKHTYSRLLEKQQALLAQALNLKPDATIASIRHSTKHYLGLETYTVDTDGLKAFINRLTDTSKSDNEWLLSILMFIGKKSPKKWLDSDKAQAEMRLSEYSRRMLDLEALRIHDQKQQENSDSFNIILIKSIKKGSPERQQPVVINKSQQETTMKLKQQLQEQLSSADKELQLAALAELLDDFLSKYQVQ